ncbi:MAG: ankyrin repeat domain-containing protein, partial [Rhodobacteraceae bacterium]|nr:ankyrin repeat domain-containing protein [Paracoccaceae bacterium]
MAFLPFLVFATEGISQTNLLLNKRFVTEANDASYTQQLEQQVKAGMDINQIDPRTGLNAISMLIHLRAKDKELLESANSLIKLLLANGADPNQVIAPSRDFSKWEGYSPLQTAVHYEFKEIVQTLIDGWADVNAKVPFPDWRTPLHLAVDMRNEEIVQALIDGWADLDTKTLDGYTALHLAVDKGNKEIVQALIKAGADLDTMTYDGYKALHLAVDTRNEEIVQVLVEAGADLDTKTLDGYTA